MKITQYTFIIMIVVSMLVLSASLVSAQEDENTQPMPLSVWESIEKYGMTVAKEIPREEWPPIPVPTHPRYIELFTNSQSEQIDRLGTYYTSGICTDYYNEDFYGLSVVINGSGIINDNPDSNSVRLTPHVVQKGSSDYLAVVLEATDDEDYLELWTFRINEDPQWQYEGLVSINSDYEYSIYVDTDNSYEIMYRSYPNGSWSLIREGTMTDREMWDSCFLEHYIVSGSPGDHGTSAWKRFVRWHSDGTGDFWNDTAYEYAVDYPLNYDTWLSGGYRYMSTWSEY